MGRPPKSEGTPLRTYPRTEVERLRVLWRGEYSLASETLTPPLGQPTEPSAFARLHRAAVTVGVLDHLAAALARRAEWAVYPHQPALLSAEQTSLRAGLSAAQTRHEARVGQCDALRALRGHTGAWLAALAEAYPTTDLAEHDERPPSREYVVHLARQRAAAGERATWTRAVETLDPSALADALREWGIEPADATAALQSALTRTAQRTEQLAALLEAGRQYRRAALAYVEARLWAGETVRGLPWLDESQLAEAEEARLAAEAEVLRLTARLADLDALEEALLLVAQYETAYGCNILEAHDVLFGPA